ncbi:MAG: hypothetical protein ACRC62_28030 [Microcoleus sp.]
MKAWFQPAGMPPLRIPVDSSRGVRQSRSFWSQVGVTRSAGTFAGQQTDTILVGSELSKS